MQVRDLDIAIGGVGAEAGEKGKSITSSGWADNLLGDDVFASEFDKRQWEPFDTDNHSSEPAPRRGPHYVAIGVLKAGNRRLRQFKYKAKGASCWSTVEDTGHQLLEKKLNHSMLAPKISSTGRADSKRSSDSRAQQNDCPFVLPQLADSGKVKPPLFTPTTTPTRTGEDTDTTDKDCVLYPGVSQLPMIPDDDHQYGDWLSPKNHTHDEDQHEGNAGSGDARETFSAKAANGPKVSRAKVSGGLDSAGPGAKNIEQPLQASPGRGNPHDALNKRNPLTVKTEACGADRVGDPSRVQEPGPNSREHVHREANPRGHAKISCDIFSPSNNPRLPRAIRHHSEVGDALVGTRRSLPSLLSESFATKKSDPAEQSLSKLPKAHIDAQCPVPPRISSKSPQRDQPPKEHLSAQETTPHSNLLRASDLHTSPFPDVSMSSTKILCPEDSQSPMTQDTLLSTPERELPKEKHGPDDAKPISRTRFTEDDLVEDGQYEDSKPRRRKLKRSTIHRLHDRFTSHAGDGHGRESADKPVEVRESQSLDLIPSDGSIQISPPRQKTSRTERVFALRMRDMLASRVQQPAKDEKECDNTKSISADSEADLKRYSEDTGSKVDIVALSSQKRPRGDQPTPAPNIPLPADPPAELVRVSSLRRLQDSDPIKSKPLPSKTSNRHSHAGEFLTAAGADNHSRPENTRNTTSKNTKRHSHIGVFHNSVPPHTATQDSNPGAAFHETKQERELFSGTTPPRTRGQINGDNLRNRPGSNHTHRSTPTPSLRHFPSDDSSRPLTPAHGNASPQHNVLHPESPQQLEARIALLERQNKMLQAALIAALDVGVTFDADVVRNHTLLPSPAAALVGPSRTSSLKDVHRRSYASTATEPGSKRTQVNVQRQSYASNKSADSANPVERPTMVDNKRTSAYGNGSAGNPGSHGRLDMPTSGGGLGIHLPEPGQS